MEAIIQKCKELFNMQSSEMNGVCIRDINFKEDTLEAREMELQELGVDKYEVLKTDKFTKYQLTSHISGRTKDIYLNPDTQVN